jgi:HK97 gp10 family phage protein
MSKGRGFQVNFSVPELGEVLQKISAYDGKSRIRIEKAVEDSTKAIKEGAQSRVREKSGRLKKHITNRFNQKQCTGYVSAQTPYAHLVEFGHEGGMVKPYAKKALTIGDGFAASANIPKVDEHPFMRPAFENEKPNLIKNIKEAVRQVD